MVLRGPDARAADTSLLWAGRRHRGVDWHTLDLLVKTVNSSGGQIKDTLERMTKSDGR